MTPIEELCALVRESMHEARNGTGWYGPNCTCENCTRWRRISQLAEELAPKPKAKKHTAAPKGKK